MILGKPMIVRTYEQAMKVRIGNQCNELNRLSHLRSLARFDLLTSSLPRSLSLVSRLQATQLDKVVIATDDDRIAKVCR